MERGGKKNQREETTGGKRGKMRREGKRQEERKNVGEDKIKQGETGELKTQEVMK